MKSKGVQNLDQQVCSRLLWNRYDRRAHLSSGHLLLKTEQGSKLTTTPQLSTIQDFPASTTTQVGSQIRLRSQPIPASVQPQTRHEKEREHQGMGQRPWWAFNHSLRLFVCRFSGPVYPPSSFCFCSAFHPIHLSAAHHVIISLLSMLLATSDRHPSHVTLSPTNPDSFDGVRAD
jgi:hypothetical protein